MSGRLLLESGAPDGYLLEDGSGVLLGEHGAYADAVLASSPVAYFRLGESSGNAIDATGGSAGTVHASVTRDVTGALSTDQDEGAISTPGTSSVNVTVPHQSKLNFGDTFTIEFFAARDRTGVGEIVVSKGNLTNGWLIGFDATNRLALYPFNSATPAYIARESGSTTDTAAHHWLVAKSGGTVLIAKDGVDVTSTSGGTAATIVDTTSAMWIGDAGGGNAFDGDIDEVALYGTALTLSNAQTHYTAGTSAKRGSASPASHASAATATGRKAAHNSGTASHASASTASGKGARRGTATASNVSSATVQARSNRHDDVVTSNTSASTATGRKSGRSSAVATNASATTALGTGAHRGTAATSSASAATATGKGSRRGTAATFSSSATTASARKSARGTAGASNTSATTASGTSSRDATLSVSATSATTAQGRKAARGTASAGHTSSTSASGTAEGSEEFSGSASTTHASSTSASGRKATRGTIQALVASTTLVAARKGARSAATVSHASTASITGKANRHSSVSVSSTSTTSADGEAFRHGSPTLVITSTTSAQGTHAGHGTASVSHASATSAGGSPFTILIPGTVGSSIRTTGSLGVRRAVRAFGVRDTSDARVGSDVELRDLVGAGHE